jgi:hypothetical protein
MSGRIYGIKFPEKQQATPFLYMASLIGFGVVRLNLFILAIDVPERVWH